MAGEVMILILCTKCNTVFSVKNSGMYLDILPRNAPKKELGVKSCPVCLSPPALLRPYKKVVIK
jgi:hypothetical protein